VIGLPRVVTRAGGGTERVIENSQIPTLFLVYGAGVVALYGLVALLYAHAYRRRESLELTPVEAFDTRVSIVGHLLAVGIGLVSIAVALAVPPNLVGLAGYAYFLFGPVMAVHGSIAGSRRRRLREKAKS
jgi:hypothetical protein